MHQGRQLLFPDHQRLQPDLRVRRDRLGLVDERVDPGERILRRMTEEIILEDKKIKITPSLVVLNGTTYAVANITSDRKSVV